MPLILHHHYAKRRCADPVAVFAIRHGWHEPIACAVFAPPANKYFGRDALELVRLVRKPEYTAPLSGFISMCLKTLRDDPRWLYCLAYADTDANHHGGIYQACSFAYIGLSKGHAMYKTPARQDLFGEVEGRIVSARSRDQSSDRTKASMVAFKSGPKHLYLKGLACRTDHVVARLGRTRLPYPKPLFMDSTGEPPCQRKSSNQQMSNIAMPRDDCLEARGR